MEWISVKTALPEASGAYIMSVRKGGSSDGWAFEYVAWFHLPGNKWLRYDPFAEKTWDTFRLEITPWVVAWLPNLPVFIP